jgi:hypothetical protein
MVGYLNQFGCKVDGNERTFEMKTVQGTRAPSASEAKRVCPPDKKVAFDTLGCFGVR